MPYPLNKRADDARLHLHRSRGAAIEADVKLCRHHLHDFDVAGHVDLLRREIEGPLAGNRALQIEDGVHFGRVDLAATNARARAS